MVWRVDPFAFGQDGLPAAEVDTGGWAGSDRQQASRKKAEEALQEIGRILASTVFGFRAHRLVRTQCKCGKLIARDVEFIEAGKVVACSTCGRLYNCRFDESRGDFDFWPQRASFRCADCKTLNSMDAYETKSGNIIECSGCGEKFCVEMRLILSRITSGTDDRP